MVSRRGEAPLVPSYSLYNLKQDGTVGGVLIRRVNFKTSPTRK